MNALWLLAKVVDTRGEVTRTYGQFNLAMEARLSTISHVPGH